MKKLIDNSKAAFNNFDEFFNFLVKEDTISLELIVVSGSCNGDPTLNVAINKKQLFSDCLTPGEHKIVVSCFADSKTNTVDISMAGKVQGDTKIENGFIVADKFITIKQLKINQFDLTADPDFFYNKIHYIKEDGTSDTVKSGFWSNSTLRIEFDESFTIWYQQCTTKNANLSDSMQYQEEAGSAEKQYNKLVNLLHLLK